MQQPADLTQEKPATSRVGLRAVGRALFWVLVALYVPLCLALIGLKWWLLPEIDRYRPQLQGYLQQQTGLPIQLGELQAQWKGLGPQVVVRQVALRTPQGDIGMAATGVRMDWSLLSLLTFRPRLNNLELESPDVLIHRDASGVFHVAGMALQASEQQDNPALDWLLEQRRVLLKNGQLRWRDDTAEFPNAVAHRAEFLLENQFGRHEAGLVFELPDLAATPVKAMASFKTPLLAAHAGDWRRWRGTLHMDAVVDQTSPLESVFKTLGLDVDLTQPQGRVWVDFDQGTVQRTLLDVRVARLRFANPEVQAAPFDITQTSALVELAGEGGVFRPSSVALKQLKGQLTGEQSFGPSTVMLQRTDQPEGQAWAVRIQNLNAAHSKAVFLDLAPHLGLQELGEELRRYQLAGTLDDVQLRWIKPPGGASFESLPFNSDINFSGLTVLYQPGIGEGQAQQPSTGFTNLSGRIRGDNLEGHWLLQAENAEVALPEIFESQRLKVDSLTGEGQWKNLFARNTPVEFAIQTLKASNADLQAQVNGRYVFNPAKSDEVELQGRLLRADVAAVPKYLPLVVGQSAREWLRENLKGGVARDGEFELKGSLDQFPFSEEHTDGLFRISVPFEQGELTYAPGWPLISKVSGQALFEGKRMHITAASAETLGVPLVNVQARIDNLDAWEPMLNITGQGKGPLKSMVAFVNQSPVRQILNEALVAAEVEGGAQLDLKLDIPIAAPENTQIEGDLALKGNAIRLVQAMPKVTGVDGKIQFSNKGLFIEGLQGQALGGLVQIKGNTDASGRMEIRANGLARAPGLAEYLNPAASPYLAGATPYAVVVSSRQGGVNIQVDSQLLGLEVKLPPPFKKDKDSPLPFALVQNPMEAGERWVVTLGTEARPVAQVRALSSYADGQSTLDSLQFAVGAPLGPPSTGVQGELRLPSLNLDDWKGVLDRLVNVQAESSSNRLAAQSLMGMWLGSGDGPGLPMRVAVRTDKLGFGKKNFEGVNVVARTIEKRWQFDIKARGVDGYLSWVSDAQRPEGAVLARFKTLTIPKTLDGDVGSIVEEPVSSIPALDITADNFTLNDMPLGRLKLVAVNQTRDEQVRATLGQRPREWRLEELVLENPESVTRAKGIWQYGVNLKNQRTDVEVNQTVKNAGGLLKRLGMEGVFQGGEGELVGRLRWDDAPSNLDYGSLGGQFKLTSRKGQFLKADPGVAKLLGVLSLQAMPRRFTLDFKDLFSDGFAYDTIEADVSLQTGVATTRNFKMVGPSATVLMDGSLDLESETQNLNVVVLPDLNATGGSLIYSLIAANPAVGIASLFADFVLKDPLSKIFSFQYKVSGPWAAPVIERVRKGTNDTPAN
ncbi:YhdP family protein [Limnobacter sp.]|uniref:YhdP family protein n=1 Tax=Limnobacter sp. TaxID=2003368 RepID=UPI003511A4FE